jgi:hypothetical protein
MYLSRSAVYRAARQRPATPGGHWLDSSPGCPTAAEARRHREEAIREGERGVALEPVSKDAESGPYIQHQLMRISMLVGEPEKALDKLEPLLKIPNFLSPGWLKIDPNFDPLRKNPRFRKLVARSDSDRFGCGVRART